VPPLELGGPFHGGAAPHYFLRNVTCGAFGGDSYDVRLHAEDGARVLITPSSATKAYRSTGATAHFRTYLEASAGALLALDSGLTILQAGSDVTQDIQIVARDGGRVVYSEVLALGRLASGERLAFRRFASSLRVRDGQDRLLYQDRYALLPATHAALIDTAVGGAGVVGSLVLAGAAPSLDALLDAADASVLAGWSTFPRGAGVVVRALGPRAEPVVQLLTSIVDAVIAESS
jgi:urease accessory protein